MRCEKLRIINFVRLYIDSIEMAAQRAYDKNSIRRNLRVREFAEMWNSSGYLKPNYYCYWNSHRACASRSHRPREVIRCDAEKVINVKHPRTFLKVYSVETNWEKKETKRNENDQTDKTTKNKHLTTARPGQAKLSQCTMSPISMAESVYIFTEIWIK